MLFSIYIRSGLTGTRNSISVLYEKIKYNNKKKNEFYKPQPHTGKRQAHRLPVKVDLAGVEPASKPESHVLLLS